MHKTKRPLSFLLAVVMIVSMFAAVPFTASATEWTDPYVVADQLQAGDIITESVNEFFFDGYTQTLAANRHGEDYRVKDTDTVMSSFRFMSSPSGVMVRELETERMVSYFFYNEDGEKTSTLIVLAADHDSRTITLAGYSEPELDPVICASSVAYRYYKDGVMQDGEKASGTVYAVTAGDSEWVNGSWYVLTESVTFTGRIKVQGTVNLILADGATLTAAKGISVNNPATLNIYGQSGGTGKLIAGFDGSQVTCGEANAAIGGDLFCSLGTLNIHGGTIVARSNRGAAIGGGEQGSTGTIAIYGGSVDAQNVSAGAAIGCGYAGNRGDNYTADVKILGGTVIGYAPSTGAAGIGKSSFSGSANGTLTIGRGATVLAGNNAENAAPAADYASTRERYVKIVVPEGPIAAYTVTWKNWDGTTLETDTDVDEGTIPTYNSAAPTRADDDTYTYTFAGWDKELTAVTEDVTYTATYTQTKKSQDQQFVTVDDQVSITLALDLGTRGKTTDDVAITVAGNAYDAAPTSAGEGVYKYKIEMAAAQIADEIAVTIDGEALPTTSIKNYCNTLCTDEAYQAAEYADARALAKATLEYGQAANDIFSANSTVDHADITSLEALDKAPVNAYTGAKFADSTGKVIGASFMALTKPEFRFYTEGIDEQTAYTYNGGEADSLTVTMDGGNDDLHARFVKKADGSVLLEVTGVTAENMDKTITVTVTGLGTITFNGNAFAKAMAKSSVAAQQNLGAALYNYGAAANACFAQH